MKTFKEFLLEVKISPDSEKAGEYWVMYNNSAIQALPKKSNSIYDDIPDKSKLTAGSAVALVSKETVNLDLSRHRSSDNRRLASKIKSYNHNASGAYPVLDGDPGVGRMLDLQKILKALIKFDPATKDYKVVGDERVHGLTVHEVINGKDGKKTETHADMFSSKTPKSLTFYHGTAKKWADQMLKVGLKPNSREESYSDQVENYSSKNIYLSFNTSEAANYATREAINTGTDAVILKVTLNSEQILKLRPDEDSIHWLQMLPIEYYDQVVEKNPIIAEIWGKEKGSWQVHFKEMGHQNNTFNLKWVKTQRQNEFTKHAQEVLKAHGLESDEDYDKLGRKLYQDLMNAYMAGGLKTSAKKAGNVAYPGKVAPNQLSVLKSWSIKGTKIHRDKYKKDDYNAALDKQASTVKRG